MSLEVGVIGWSYDCFMLLNKGSNTIKSTADVSCLHFLDSGCESCSETPVFHSMDHRHFRHFLHQHRNSVNAYSDQNAFNSSA